MAARSTSASVPQTAAERLAAYRAAAKSLAPAAEQPREDRALSEVVGKIAADTRGFFSNVRAVYQVERKLQGF